jgi:hypothetical protein
MAQFNTIHSNIWEDEKFRKLKSSDSRLLFIHLFSNTRCPVSGIYKIAPETMSFETNIIPDCKANLEEIIQVGLVLYDYEKSAIWVRGKIKHDKAWKAPMRMKSIKRSLDEFSQCSFMESVIKQYPQLTDLAVEVEKEQKELRGVERKSKRQR